jgi:hypothetical protein
VTTTAAGAVDVRGVRRWVRRRQASHRDLAATLGNVYFGLLLAGVLIGFFWPTVQAVFWPAAPQLSGWTAVGVAATCLGAVLLAARRLGPLALSRAAASWLLTAPVSRRALLLPALLAAAAAAACTGLLVGAALVAQVGARPVTGGRWLIAGLTGALLGVGTLLLAYAGQAGRRWADALAYPLLLAGLCGLLAGTGAPVGRFGGPPPPVTVLLTVVVGVGAGWAVRRLASTPNERILQASHTTGTLFDSAYGVEPSFVTELVERRYWAGRRLRSTPLPRWMPLLTGQDLRLLRRKPRRLFWLAVTTCVPLLTARGPVWLLPVILLLGMMSAAASTAATVRTDSGNPVLLRLLGLSSRQVVGERLWVPGGLAAAWAAAALVLLARFGDLPPGPWWALGLALGPVGALAAVSRARLGFVRNGLLPLETPFGTVATGPVLAAVGGFDMLVLAVPAVVSLVGGSALTYQVVSVQAVLSAVGVGAYLLMTTSPERTELAR